MIRPVVLPDDLSAIALLEEALFPENNMGERMLLREMREGRAWVSGEPIHAYALVRQDGDIVDLIRLGVLPGWQNQGIGSRLLDAVLGLDEETMLTVEKRNHAAIRLYLAKGFGIAGALPEAWVMRRPVR